MTMHFFARLDRLDQLLEKGPEGVDFLRDVADLLQEAASGFYFFTRVEDGDWMPTLRTAGVFDRVPRPVTESSGATVYPPWPAIEALRNLASACPEEVGEILGRLGGTGNRRVHLTFLEIALDLPPEEAVVVVPFLDQWLEENPRFRYSEELGDLVVHLAGGAQTEEALEALASGLSLKAGIEDKDITGFPRARIEPWAYERLLERHLEAISKHLGFRAFRVVAGILEEGLGRKGDEVPGPDHSHIWLPKIDSERPAHGDLRMILTRGLRDLAIRNVIEDPHSLPLHLEYLKKRGSSIFRRLGLHLLNEHGADFPELRNEWLGEPTYLRDVESFPEYAPLISQWFGEAEPEVQKRLLQTIHTGLDLDRVRTNIESFRGAGSVSDDDLSDLNAQWKRDRLALIEPGLPDAEQVLLDQLRDAQGKARSLEPENAHTEVEWVSFESPVSAEELKGEEWQFIAELLKTWTPEKGANHSYEGLARTFQAVVVARPEEAARGAVELEGTAPVFIRAFAQGLADAVDANRTVEWTPVLELFQWAVGHSSSDLDGKDSTSEEGSGDWREALKAIGRLLEKGVRSSDTSGLQVDLAGDLWEVVVPLTEHWDPLQPPGETTGRTALDPATRAINSVRGQALHLVVSFALWRRRAFEAAADEEAMQKGLDALPEVRQVLDTHLDLDRDASLAVRSVYGQFFPWLHLLDPNWAVERVPDIFPLDQTSESLFDAAWNSYMAFTRPFSNVIDVLKPCYHRAVDRIKPREDEQDDVTRRLGEHLLTYYWQGSLTLWSEGLVARYFRYAGARHRAQVIQFVGRSLNKSSGDLPRTVLAGLTDLWEQRILAAREAYDRSIYVEEMESFASWVTANVFPVQESLRRYRRSLLTTASSESTFFSILPELEKMWQEAPREVLEVLQVMISRTPHAWWTSDSAERILAILRDSIAEESLRPLAEELTNDLARGGLLEARDIAREISAKG